MSRKASKVKLANPKVMKAFIVFGITFQTTFALALILIQNVFNMTSEPIICSNLEHTVSIKSPYVSMIAVINHTAIILFGLCCDISLYVFLKQRNLQLIPWTSNQDDPSIPMKATLVTMVSLIIEVLLEIVMKELRRLKHSADCFANSSHIIESAAISAS